MNLEAPLRFGFKLGVCLLCIRACFTRPPSLDFSPLGRHEGGDLFIPLSMNVFAHRAYMGGPSNPLFFWPDRRAR